MALILLFGTPTAYLLATRTVSGQALLVTLVELPLIFPPAVAGLGLLAAFGRLGLLGGSLEPLGIDIAFTKVAVILAVTFVASPFYVRTAISAFESSTPISSQLPAPSARARRTSDVSRFPLRPAGLERERHSRLREGSASSARRSCSPGRSRASPRRSLSRCTRSSTWLSTRPRDRRAARLASALILLTAKVVPAGDAGARPQSRSPRLPTRARARGRGRDRRARRPLRSGEVECAARCRRTAAPGAGLRPLRPTRPGSTAEGVDLPPERRGVGLVFQESALFPHLTFDPTSRSAGAIGELLPSCSSASRSAASRPRARQTSGGDASGSRSRERWHASPPSSCSTSRSRRSTLTHARAVRAEHSSFCKSSLADGPCDPRLRRCGRARRPGRSPRRRPVLQIGSPPELVARRQPVRRRLHGGESAPGSRGTWPDGLTGSRSTRGQVRRRLRLGPGGPCGVPLGGRARRVPDDSAVDSPQGTFLHSCLSATVSGSGGAADRRDHGGLGGATRSREGDVVVASFKATGTRLLPYA